jgi:hypothetical protein
MRSTLALVFSAFALVAAKPAAAGVIAGSAHDFTSGSWNLTTQVCVVCHTPHKSDTGTTAAALWNHTNSSATYTLYTSTTLKATDMAQPGANSKLCLSCHDGTVAVDAFGGTTGARMIGSVGDPKANVGTSLADDHPIGFTYDATLSASNGSLALPTDVVTIGTGGQTKVGSIDSTMLFAHKMECSSCHDVHNTFTVGLKGSGMVKISTAGSAICLACHKK